MNKTLLNRHFLPSVALFVFLATIYLFTYQGYPVSTDELTLFDATESMANRQDDISNITFNYPSVVYNNLKLEATYVENRQEAGSIFTRTQYEPLHPILSTPFLRLAQSSNAIGQVHSVWLFNILIIPLIAIILALFALEQGSSNFVAWGTGLIFGLGTMVWPYAQTYFREPLNSLFILLTLIYAIKYYEAPEKTAKKVQLLSITFAFFALSLLVKSSSFGIFPSLVLLILPSYSQLKHYKREMLWASIIGLVGAIALLKINQELGLLSHRFTWNYWEQRLFTNASIDFVLKSLFGYHFSFGRSIWLFSPLLLIGFWGAYLLSKQNKLRLVVAIYLVVIVAPIAYGLTHKGMWWGALGYGPRFMVPFIPILMIPVIPALDEIQQKSTPVFWKIATIAIILLSIVIQIMSIIVPLKSYYAYLAEHHINVNTTAIWEWEWSHLGVELDLLSAISPINTWQEYALNSTQILGLFAFLLLSSAILMYIHFTNKLTNRHRLLLGVGVSLLWIFTVVYSLYNLREDPRYIINREGLAELIEELEVEAEPDDIIFLENPTWRLLFMNNFDSRAMVVTLPYPPGEYTNPNDTPQISTTDPGEAVGPLGQAGLDEAAQTFQRQWIVISTGPFITYAQRPSERYMVDHHFPVMRLEPSQLARAILFDTTAAPTGDPENMVNLKFMDQLELIGYDLPRGTEFQAGDIIPISLLWTVQSQLETDYNISVQLAQQDGFPLVQRDGLFQDTFGYTSRWQVDETYRDNHGLMISDEIAPGTYQIQVIIYQWQNGERLQVYDNEEFIGDVAVLTQITIR